MFLFQGFLNSINSKLNHKKQLRKTFKKVFRGYKTLEEIKLRYNSDV